MNRVYPKGKPVNNSVIVTFKKGQRLTVNLLTYFILCKEHIVKTNLKEFKEL